MVDIMNDAELALLSLLSEDTHSDIELHNLIEARGLRPREFGVVLIAPARSPGRETHPSTGPHGRVVQ